MSLWHPLYNSGIHSDIKFIREKYVNTALTLKTHRIELYEHLMDNRYGHTAQSEICPGRGLSVRLKRNLDIKGDNNV